MFRDVTNDLLKLSAHRAVADAIGDCREAILARWERRVRAELPRADRLTLEQLRDEVPAVLAELSATLAADDGSAHLDRLLQAGDGHGRLRFDQSYDLAEVMEEYGLLRPILLDEVSGHLGRDLHPEESAAVNLGLDAAVRRSVTQFAAHQQDRVHAAAATAAAAHGRYLSVLSHDLRGGLNGVLLMVEVLKRELAGEDRFAESMADLDAMRRSIMDTVGTMDRFLHAERLRAGKVVARKVPLDLGRAVSEVLAPFTSVARDKGVRLEIDLPTGVTVSSDKELLGLIVQNLVGNAVKYTAPGTVVGVAVTAGGHGAFGARVRVTDQGPGIADGLRAALFRPFGDGQTGGPAGVGLGLSIAKRAAELIGADLSATSTLGVGSTFTLDLR